MQGFANQLLIRLTSAGGQPLRSVLVKESDLSRSDVPLFCGSAANGDVSPLPGEGDKAFVVRRSRIHAITRTTGAHTDLAFLAESCRGVLFEHNRFDGSDAIGDANVSSTLQVQGQTATFGNMVFRFNHFISDNNGHMFNFDRDDSVGGVATTEQACADPVHIDNNVFTWTSDTLFSTASAGRECPSITARPGSTCDGNTALGSQGNGFADGAAIECTGTGF